MWCIVWALPIPVLKPVNWYDTGNLEPLKPRYVSTVDSGNLAGCLLALGQGLQVPPQEPIWRCQSWQGLVDALVVLEETIETLGGRELEMAVSRLLDCLRQIRRLVSEVRRPRRSGPNCWKSCLPNGGRNCSSCWWT